LKCRFIIPFLLAATILFSGCQKDVLEAPVDSTFGLTLPAHFPNPVYNFKNNPLSPAGIELGRLLFYDKDLSADGNISCASCHLQNNGFSDPGQAVSAGVFGRTGRRNSTPIFNLIWSPNFMWDGGIKNLEIMPLAPFTEHTEMDLSMHEVIEIVSAKSIYRNKFKEAFGSDSIYSQKIFFALAQFQSSLLSVNSKYDAYINNQITFTPEEKSGLNIFRAKCSSCHQEPLFTNYGYHNNGSPKNVAIDLGRYEITLNESDKGKFRVPSLRNVALTFPYMHNGSISTLEEVLDHYSSLSNNTNSNIDPVLTQNFSLSHTEKNHLIAFLETLTDSDLNDNPNFSNPW
jgi:cytochrome c peroxidase